MSKQNQRMFFVIFLLLASILAVTSVFASTETAEAPIPQASGSHVAWWVWPLSLFIVTFIYCVILPSCRHRPSRQRRQEIGNAAVRP